MKIAVAARHLRTALKRDDRRHALELLERMRLRGSQRETERAEFVSGLVEVLRDVSLYGDESLASIILSLSADWDDLTETERALLSATLLDAANTTRHADAFLALIETVASRYCTITDVRRLCELAAKGDEYRRHMVAHALGHALAEARSPEARQAADEALQALESDASDAVRSESRAARARAARVRE